MGAWGCWCPGCDPGVPVVLGEILGLSWGAGDPWVLGIPEVWCQCLGVWVIQGYW